MIDLYLIISIFFSDALYGSKWTFKSRIHACLIVQIACLIIAPFAGYYGLIIVSMIIGCATWIAHSCTTSLSGMVKFNSSIMQQIGFALPAVFGIITSLVFNLSSDDIPDLNIMLFFFSIALFVIPGNITWVSAFASLDLLVSFEENFSCFIAVVLTRCCVFYL